MFSILKQLVNSHFPAVFFALSPFSLAFHTLTLSGLCLSPTEYFLSPLNHWQKNANVAALHLPH